MKKLTICGLLCIFLIFPQVFAQQATGFEWELRNSGEVVITGYTGTNKEVTIPNAISGMPVTIIGDNAFADKQLTRVNIPNSVIYIGDFAFADNRLTSIRIPKGVVYIRDGAFAGNRLTSVTLPDSVKFIGTHAFSRNRLTGITIPPSVVDIGLSVCQENPLTSSTSGENMPLDPSYPGAGLLEVGIFGIEVSFDQAYRNSGRRAG
ncbi:MAG: leucine-rich repeat domain-containing protein, partial [Treponema sp.]|nr:leucine-rich repeat domain-containing protein [Treponema sp.]